MSVRTLSSLTETYSLRNNILPALSAMLLGSLLVLAVGFAPMEAVHNTAHDTRHSANFPCH
jgi:cobalt transporter subunit CbtB